MRYTFQDEWRGPHPKAPGTVELSGSSRPLRDNSGDGAEEPLNQLRLNPGQTGRQALQRNAASLERGRTEASQTPESTGETTQGGAPLAGQPPQTPMDAAGREAPQQPFPGSGAGLDNSPAPAVGGADNDFEPYSAPVNEPDASAASPFRNTLSSFGRDAAAQDSPASGTGLQAMAVVDSASPPPDSLSEISELSRLLRVPEGMLASQPELVRRQLTVRALAANPGLLRFARQSRVNGSIATGYARQGLRVAQAFDMPISAADPALSAPAQTSPAQPYNAPTSLPSPHGASPASGDAAPAYLDPASRDAPSAQNPGFSPADGRPVGKSDPASVQAGSAAKKPHTLADQFIDPFKNFANGWLDMARAVMGAGQSVADLAAGRDSGLSRWFQNWLKSLDSLELDTREPASFMGRLARDVTRSAPQLAAQIGLWLGAGPLASTSYMFGQIYGSDYIRHSAKGVSPGNAVFAGLVDASLQASMERMGLSAIMKTPGLGQFTRSLSRAGLLNRGAEIAKGAGKAALIEGGTEAMQHMPEYLTDWWAESSLGARSVAERVRWTWRKATDAASLMQGTREALYQGLVGGILGAPVGAVNAALARRRLDPELDALLEREKLRASQAVRRLALDEAMRKAREAVADIRDPQAARGVAASSLPDNLRHVLIDAADLSSLLARDPNAAPRVLNALGNSVEEINQAIATGADLEVDLAHVLASRDAEAEMIAEICRLESDGPTLASASAWDPESRLAQVFRILNQEDGLDDFSDNPEDQALAREAQKAQAMAARVNRQINRLQGEMRKAGLNALEAETNAALIRAHAMTWWKRYGADPETMLSQWSVEHGGQNPYAGSPARGRQLGRPELEPELLTPEIPEWMNGPATPAPRRAVLRGQALIARGRAIIRLFSDRDVSTMSHEAGHIFIDDLLGMARDRGQSALERLRGELADNTGEDMDFMDGIESRLREILQSGDDLAPALTDFARDLMRQSRETQHLVAEAERNADATAGREREAAPADPEAEARATDPGLTENAEAGALGNDSHSDAYYLYGSRAQTLRAISRAVSRCASHLEAVTQAMEDVETLARHAGLDAEALAMAMDLTVNDSPPSPAAEKAYTTLQEAGARALASWLAGNRPPSPRLAPVMSRISSWLTSLWKNCRNMRPARLDPALARTFDRLLATDSEMRLQRGIDSLNQHEQALFDDPRLDRKEIRDLREMLSRVQAQAASGFGRLRRDREKKVRAARLREVLARLREDPFWILADRARLDRSLVEGILGRQRTEELALVRPRLFGGKKGQDPADLALEAGYPSAEALLTELHERLALRHETLSGSAELQVDEEMEARRRTEEFGDFSTPESLGKYLERADQAVARIVAKMHLRTEREIERWVEHSRVPQNAVDSMAMMRVSAMPLRQLTEASLRKMLDRALRERNRLLQSSSPSDLMRAMTQATEARVVNAMLNLAAAAHKKAFDLRRYAREIISARPGSFGSVQTEALRVILSTYGLGQMRAPRDLAYMRALPDLIRDICQAEDVAGSLASFPDWLLHRQDPQGIQIPGNDHMRLRDLSPEQLRDLENLIRFVARSGRDCRKQDLLAEQRQREADINACVERMAALPDRPTTSPDTVRGFFRQLSDKIWGAMDILLWQARKADGLTNVMGEGQSGPMEALWHQIISADERVRGWNDRLNRALAPHFRQLEKARDRLEQRFGRHMKITDQAGNPVLPPEKWRRAHNSDSFTAEMIFAMALHLGNRSNISRLMSGYQGDNGLTLNTVRTLFGSRMASHVALADQLRAGFPEIPETGLLTGEDWKAIQGIWDALALLWPDTRATHLKLYGFAPESVGAVPFTVSDENGEPLRLAGGYFPVRYDGHIDDRVGAWSEQEDILARNEAMYTAPSAKRGFTMARSAQTPGLPIRLDLSPIGEHVADAAKFIEYAPLVRRFDRVSQDKNFAAMYRRKFGAEDYNMIRPNLRGLLRTEKPSDVIAWLEQKIRKFVVPWGLSWNFNVALLQTGAIFPAMGDVGASHVRGALASLAANPGLHREIFAASPYMRSRLGNLDQDLTRQLRNFQPKRPLTIQLGRHAWSWDDVVDCGMKLISGVDVAASCAVWLAAYRSRLLKLRAIPRETRAAGSPPLQNPAPFTDRASAPPASPAPATPPSADADKPSTGAAPSSGDSDIGELLASFFRGSQPRTRENTVIDFSDALHGEAARYADMVVKQSNPDFDPNSRSGFLRSRGMMRLFNQFSSAIALFASRNHFMGEAMRKGRLSRGAYARHLAWDYLAPAIALWLFFGVTRDFWDKKDKPVANFTGLFLDQASMTVPMIGGLASDWIQQALGLGQGNFRRGDLRVSMDAPVELLNRAASSVGRLHKDHLSREERKQTMYALLDVLSFLSRVPVSKVMRKAERGYDQYRRGEGTPASILIPKGGK